MEVEFKLFGSLTIKQFGYLAAGLLLAVMLFFTSLPFLLKFPLIILCIIMGGFLSLVRINGQSSSVWVNNFIVAMFTPQERVWKRSAVVPDVLQEGQNINQVRDVEMIHKVRANSDFGPKVQKYDLEPKVKTELDNYEDERLKQIQMTFSSASQPEVHEEKVNEERADMLTALLKGFVVDREGRAIGNALISLNNSNGEFVAEAVTDNQGLFSIQKRLVKGSYILSINCEGYEFDYFRIDINQPELPTYKFSAK